MAPRNDDAPIIHLPLDELVDGKFADVSGNNHATPNGNAVVVYDDDLGAVMELDGQCYLDLPSSTIDFARGFTAAVWIKPAKLDTWSRIFDFWMDSHVQSHLSSTAGITADVWVHVAYTMDAVGNVHIYLDGIKKGSAQCPVPSTATRTNNYIGRSNWNGDPYYTGRMAHFRMYSRLLVQDDLLRIMQLDKLGRYAVRGASPLSFDLYTVKDDDHQPILFIESTGQGDPLELQIKNDAASSIVYEPLEAPTDSGFHFQLRFRKGVLSAQTLNALRSGAQGDWKYVSYSDSIEQVDWVSFIRTNIPPDGVEIAPGGMDRITLPAVCAAAESGARNTRVEVKYANVRYADAEQAMSGYCMKHLEIQSHLGLKTLPLIMGIEGSNTLLNDGKSSNSLTLFIANPDANRPVRMTPESTSPAAPSQFVISFQEPTMYQDAPSIVASPGSAGALEDRPPPGEPSWKFIWNDAAEPSLTSGAPIKIQIDGWITSHSTGVGNIYVQYENIPGYWDGVYVVQVQFSTMVERQVQTEERIGIGVLDPEAKLHVRGPLTKLESKLEVSHPRNDYDRLDSQDGALVIRRSGGTVGYIRPQMIGTRERLCIGSALGGALTQSYSDDVRTTGISEQNVLIWDWWGNVGIGLGTKDGVVQETAQERLHVNGNIRAEGNINAEGEIKSKARISDKTGAVMPVGAVIAYAGSAPAAGWLLCDGRAITGDDYSDLRTALGRDHVPDLRSRFVLGAGQGAELSLRSLHQKDGEEEHLLTVAQMPAHTHTINNGDFGQHFRSYQGEGDEGDPKRPYETNPTYTQNTDFAGGDAAHNNMPPFYVLTYIIKY